MTAPLTSLHDYEAAAMGLLDSMAAAYFSGGAGDEVSMRANAQAFARFAIIPRVLQSFREGTSGTRTQLLGEDLRHPILVAPVAYQRLAHEDGERATALAASAQEALMVLSTQSSIAMEEVREAGPACRWFQLYMQPRREATRALVKRAEAAGFTALMLTVDAPVSGLRNREQRSGFRLPAHIHADALEMLPQESPREVGPDDSIIFDHIMPAAPTWDDVAWLREETPLPIVIKGILSVEDALLARKAGAEAIVISNHGGRTLDTLPPPLHMLPEIRTRVGKHFPLIIDGGIRRGTDVFKALALGANAVMIGRPIIHGLAVSGALGVSHVLRLLRDELEIAMALSGCANIPAITRDKVRSFVF